VILVHDSDPDLRTRGGDSFILTPYFIGSRATGWVDTKSFELRNGPITLASAMTASGAAATANAGYIGSGVTRDRVVSMLMSIFNLRLGLLIANPFKRKSWLSWWGPNFLYSGLICGVLNRGYRHDSHLIELSDGGHFENLGLYELIRRRVQVIVVVDGEEDKLTTLPAMTSALRRINKDFPGTIVQIDPNRGPGRLVANISSNFPNGTHHAEHPYFVAKLRYPAVESLEEEYGVLIYCKAVMIDELSLLTAGYMGRNPDFPHQTTLNQFFEPDQFEAYRELGYECMKRTIADLNLVENISSVSAIRGEYWPLKSRC
jgi:hypothetical protein